MEIKSTILGGRVLRARTPAGIQQEIITYHLLRTVMADATATLPGLDPDRASFSIALHAARDQVIRAANILAETVVDLVGAIGRQVLAHLMPALSYPHSPPRRQARHLQVPGKRHR
ncbi:hypothetical protein ABGB18_46035 [Nonomuraea sp. B12E4]|uniref:hypothetical protein n=1 Tax=Nonomuraea sp. B12E4 TaxID=3153564 RepID=UPI00325EA464